MWGIYEHKRVTKSLKSASIDVLKKYEKWKDIVAISGPQGLLRIKGFRDELLSGEWKDYRSSRLNLQYRVIYKVETDKIMVHVENVTPDDYPIK
ncbi:MAG: type II toxin-antitoxin system mRNA interferase toxin, RelE/StbE family [Pseudomonadales bacterium]|nr:type II toxin-antitoxin system mRNA interferase toxin, RelE/StbE family [Pseudomonadales bacterium]